MKAEHTEVPPRFNLLKSDGVRSQGRANDVTHIMLNNGITYPISPKTFKFYKVNSNTGVPYVTFVVHPSPEDEWGPAVWVLRGKRLEVFPASITGIAYNEDDDEDEADDAAQD